MLCAYHAITMLFWKWLLKAMAQCGMCIARHAWISIGCPDGIWATYPCLASSGYHVEFREGCYQKHAIPLNCRTSSLDISSYHLDFNEGHGTVREWQGHSMACVN
jgi:hypothetical protein